jgi:hypothetical protein
MEPLLTSTMALSCFLPSISFKTRVKFVFLSIDWKSRPLKATVAELKGQLRTLIRPPPRSKKTTLKFS